MPEALAVVAVFAVAVAAWVGAFLQARNPAGTGAEAEISRLRHHVAWLERRLELAQQEQWGADMIANLADEHAAALDQLAKAAGAGSEKE